MRAQEVVPDLAFDYQTIAEQVRQVRKFHKKSLPGLAHLTTAITTIRLEDTIEGSSTLEITVVDSNFELIEFFEISETGRIFALDLNYPLDSGSWWRLSGLDVSGGVNGAEFVLTFIERPVAWLTHKHGPKKMSRGKATRAEFFQSLVKEVKAGRGLRFFSYELHVKQQIEGQGSVTSGQDRNGDGRRRSIPNGATPKIQGTKAVKRQLELVTLCLDIADELHASDRAVDAMLVAGIGESGFKEILNTAGSGYGGVFQGDVEANYRYFKVTDTEAMCRHFFKGGKGYQAGGAIAAAKANKDWSPGKIALEVEGSRSNFASEALGVHHYQQYIDEARDLKGLAGGNFSGTGGGTYRQQYNFQVGDDANPRETYWDGMTRLAQDVNWRLFVNGRTIYFDSDMTLVRRRPAYIVKREDPAVIGWSARWDDRRIATEATLELICAPFDYRAGDVFLLEDFGPISNGSTAEPAPLPGRWLIASITRNSGDLSSTFTLVQPGKPNLEPASDLGQHTREDDELRSGSGLGDVTPDMEAKELIDELVVPLAKKHRMVTGISPAGIVAANGRHLTNVAGSSNVSWHKGPPTTHWASDMSNGQAPTPQMDALADELFDVFRFSGAKSHDHVYAFPSVTHKGFRFQLGYKTMIGGNHFNHVHFGAARDLTAEELSSKYGWGNR
jgi:hypothetical protein